MAKFYSVEATKAFTGLDSKNIAKRQNGDAVNKSLGLVVDTFAIPAALASNDVIGLPRLPKGAILLPDMCAVKANKKPAETSIAFKIGNAADDDEYSGAVTVNAAGTFAFTGATDYSIAAPAEFTADTDTDILATATVTGAVDTTATLVFFLVYAIR